MPVYITLQLHRIQPTHIHGVFIEFYLICVNYFALPLKLIKQ